MGLRINTNVSSITALRNLHVNDRIQARSLERLSTGLRINRGADDPSGLVISEQLRAQIAGLNQASENSQNASNLINVADASLQEVSDLLVQIQDSIIFALNTGGASPDQIAAEQDSVDQAIAAIDRIAATTRYGDREILNGSAAYQLIGSEPTTTAGTPVFTNLRFRNVEFSGDALSRKLDVTLIRRPERAEILVSGAATAGATIIRITGSRGTEDVALGSGSNATDIAAAINNVAPLTGVFASAAASTASGTPDPDLFLYSEDFGNNQLIRLEGVQGTINTTAFQVRDDTGNLVAVSPSPGTDLTTGEVISDRGVDAQVTFQGILFTGSGRAFSINTRDVSFEFELNSDIFQPFVLVGDLPAVSPDLGSIHSLYVGNTGLQFQLREQPLPSDRIGLGIDSISSSSLGTRRIRDLITEMSTTAADTVYQGGFLNSLKTGAGNDLTQNAQNAHVITRSAIGQVAGLRGFLGAMVAFNIEPNIDSIAVESENLQASLSDIRDLDFAEETSNFTRSQILFQSGIAVLASANLIPQSILTLLS